MVSVLAILIYNLFCILQIVKELSEMVPGNKSSCVWTSVNDSTYNYLLQANGFNKRGVAPSVLRMSMKN